MQKNNNVKKISVKSLEGRQEVAVNICNQLNTLIKDEEDKVTEEEVRNWVADTDNFETYKKARLTLRANEQKNIRYGEIKRSLKIKNSNSKAARINYLMIDPVDTKESEIKNKIHVQKVENEKYQKFLSIYYLQKILNAKLDIPVSDNMAENIDAYSKNTLIGEFGFLTGDIKNALQDDYKALPNLINRKKGCYEQLSMAIEDTEFYRHFLGLIIPPKALKSLAKLDLDTQYLCRSMIQEELNKVKEVSNAGLNANLLSMKLLQMKSKEEALDDSIERPATYLASLFLKQTFNKDFMENKGFYELKEDGTTKLIDSDLVDVIASDKGKKFIVIDKLPDNILEEERKLKQKIATDKIELALSLVEENVADINSTLGVFTRDSQQFKALHTKLNDFVETVRDKLKEVKDLDLDAKSATLDAFLEDHKKDFEDLSKKVNDYTKKKDEDRKKLKPGKEFNERTCKRLAYCDHLKLFLNEINNGLTLEEKVEVEDDLSKSQVNVDEAKEDLNKNIDLSNEKAKERKLNIETVKTKE